MDQNSQIVCAAANGESPYEETPLLSSSLSETPEAPTVQKELDGDTIGQNKLGWIMASVWIGTFCAGLDSTIIATLGSTIATEFRSFSLYAWLATAYLIATALTQPLSGKLTDIYSRRYGLFVCNLLFALGNLMCGLARGPGMILIGRTLAGLGGGGLNSISTLVANDFIPLRKRGVYQGLSNICWGLGNGLGGVFGGFVNDIWGWKLAFLVQIPFTLISIFLVYLNLEKPKFLGGLQNSRIKSVDFTGAMLLVSTLVLFLLGVNSGGNIVPWTHPLVLVSLPMSVVLLGAFVIIEEKVATNPILPVRLLLDRTVACACLTNWFFIMIVYALYFYAILFFRINGLSVTKAGATLIPFSIATALGSLGAGIIMNKTGKYRLLNFTMLVLMVSTTSSITISTLGLPQWTTVIFLGLTGLAVGGELTVMLLALTAAVDYEQQAVVTSLSYAFRSTGSVIGVALASTVFQNVLSRELWVKLGSRKDAGHLIDGIRNSLDTIDALPIEDRQIVTHGYTLALQATFLTLVGLAVLALVCGSLVKEHKLYLRNDRADQEE